MINIICALAENNAIGYNNDLLFHLRADLQRFKALTTGHTVIMGRRTFESLPKGALPNRRNIVLSSGEHEWPNVEVYPSLQEAIAACADDEEVFIIGGASVYKAALPIADRLCLTHVHAVPEAADVFFPEFDGSEWECTFKEDHDADERNDKPFTFADYIRK